MVGRASEEDGRTPDIEGMAVSERSSGGVLDEEEGRQGNAGRVCVCVGGGGGVVGRRSLASCRPFVPGGGARAPVTPPRHDRMPSKWGWGEDDNGCEDLSSPHPPPPFSDAASRTGDAPAEDRRPRGGGGEGWASRPNGHDTRSRAKGRRGGGGRSK